MDSIYISETFYNQFWNEVMGSEKAWTVTGTPGVGKTFFSFFMFHKIRQNNASAIIVRIIS